MAFRAALALAFSVVAMTTPQQPAQSHGSGPEPRRVEVAAPPTTTPTRAFIGETLTAQPGTWVDPANPEVSINDSLTFTYEWRAHGGPTPPPNDKKTIKGPTLHLTQDFAAQQIDLRVHAQPTPGSGLDGTHTTIGVGLAFPRPEGPLPTGEPVIQVAAPPTTTPTQAFIGETLTAQPGTWVDPANPEVSINDSLTFTYEWRAHGGPTPPPNDKKTIKGPTLHLTPDFAAQQIDLRVHAQPTPGSGLDGTHTTIGVGLAFPRPAGTTAPTPTSSPTSAPTSGGVTSTPTTGPPPVPSLGGTSASTQVIVNDSLPVISGRAKVGHRLRASAGKWTPSSGVRFRYQWIAGKRVIPGARKATLKLTKGLRGKRIQLEVTAIRSGSPPTMVTSKATPRVRR